MKMDAGRQCFLTIGLAIILATSLCYAASAGVQGRGVICRDQCRLCLDLTDFPNHGLCEAACVQSSDPSKYEYFCLQFMTCGPLPSQQDPPAIPSEYTANPPMASYSIGTTVTVACSVGYIVRGHTTHAEVASATCQEDQTWSEFSLPCDPIDEVIYDVALGASPGLLQSPGYPAQYDDYLDITWLLRTGPGNRIHIKFTYFNLENVGTQCSYCDHVHVFDSNSAYNDISGRLCGDLTSQYLQYDSSGNVMLIYFFSDACCSPLDGGLEIEYEAISP